MVPPPEHTGDEFPDFENMTPEEQMAWLETLARRQGANADEFMTAADLDIPVPEDAEIDEPGYVPYSVREQSGSRAGQVEQAADSDQEPEAAPEPISVEEADAGEAETAPIVDDEEFQSAAFDASAAMNEPAEAAGPEFDEMAAEDEILAEDAADPMTWLDGISAHAGDDLEALFAEFEDDAELEEQLAEELPRDLSAAEEASLATADVEPEDTADAQESVADTEQWPPLVDEVPEDVTDVMQEVDVPEAAVETRPAESRQAEEAEFADELPESVNVDVVGDEDDPLGGMDPMLFLETLGRRQGARAEELLTSADAEIAEVSDDVVIDEPGYVPYDMIMGDMRDTQWDEDQPEAPSASASEQALSAGQDMALDEFLSDDELMAEFENDDLSWFDRLGEIGEPSDAEEFAETESDEEPLTLLPPADDAVYSLGQQAEDESSVGDETGEIERRPESEPESAVEQGDMDESLAWLTDFAAEPGDDVADFLATDEGYGDLVDSELPISADEQQTRAGMPEGASAIEGPIGEQEEAVPPIEETASRGALPPAEPAVLPDWLVEMRGQHPEEISEDLARNMPEWLSEEPAISDAALEDFLAGEVEPSVDDGEDLAAAAPIDMPDWLKEPVDEAAESEDLPAWLDEGVADAPRGAYEAQQGPSMPAVSADVGKVEAEIPDGERYAQYRERLAENPHDHSSRLALAQSLLAGGQLEHGLSHYEVLIENAQLLDDVASDLKQAAGSGAPVPRSYRLLGDVYVRQGKLQDALDAYRQALNQL